MDKEMERSLALRRRARRKRRQRQRIRRCLLVVAGLIVLGLGINKIMKEDSSCPVEDEATKMKNEDT